MDSTDHKQANEETYIAHKYTVIQVTLIGITILYKRTSFFVMVDFPRNVILGKGCNGRTQEQNK